MTDLTGIKAFVVAAVISVLTVIALSIGGSVRKAHWVTLLFLLPLAANILIFVPWQELSQWSVALVGDLVGILAFWTAAGCLVGALPTTFVIALFKQAAAFYRKKTPPE